MDRKKIHFFVRVQTWALTYMTPPKDIFQAPYSFLVFFHCFHNFLEKPFKVAPFKFRTFSDGWAFISVRKNVSVAPNFFELERIEHADQWSYLIDAT